MVCKSICKPEDFELVKNNKFCQSVYAKVYTKKSGKVKCRISVGSSQNVIGVEELVDENFKGSCIIKIFIYYTLKIFQVYIGSIKSISFSVEEILAREIESRRSYFEREDSSDESDEEDEE